MHAECQPASQPLVATDRAPLVALIGNPNTGKTTLFNQLTGSRARVGNYPGITVERRLGKLELGEREVGLLDLPGTYSLTARSHEEQIALEAVLGFGEDPAPDLSVVVVDAGQLVRNLYLVLQLIELEVPLVVVINMIDEVATAPDLEALSALFGVPFIATSARTGQGLSALRRALEEGLAAPPRGSVALTYPAALDADIAAIVDILPPKWKGGGEARKRGLALWALSSIDDHDELAGIDPKLRARCLARHGDAPDRDFDAEIISARYAFLDSEVREPATPTTPPKAQRLTDRIDRVALHPVFGFVVFISMMLIVFQTLFSWSDPFIGLIEDGFGWLGTFARAHLGYGFGANLLIEGVIGGVGNVVVFLPQIVLLFLLLGLLEDSGYMARAAYLMDRVMKSLGLHGRAFVPMLSGCACAIPAIMATRTMERQRDRLLTMMVIPLMTCSARLPIYTLIIAALFPPDHLLGVIPLQGLLMVGMYFFATFTALAAAGILGRTLIKGRSIPLLLELPPYRLPTWRSVARQAAERAAVFLKEAGTVIMVCTIAFWALLSYPAPDSPRPLATKAIAGLQQQIPRDTVIPASAESVSADNADALASWQAGRLARSYGGRLGKAIEPAIAPLGFDWKLGVGLLGAFTAREVFVSTLGLIYGIGDADEDSASLRDKISNDRREDGRASYPPLVGLSLMVFFALACQCMSTIAVVRRETRSWRWPAFLFAYMTALAWLASFLVYQGGRLLGFVA